MQAEKISISLSQSLLQFIESYKIAKGYKSPSKVIEVALDTAVPAVIWYNK